MAKNLSDLVKSLFGGVGTDLIDDVTIKSGTASKSDGQTIAHGLGVAPTFYGAFATVATHIATVTAVDATNLTIALKTDAAGAVGTPENVNWFARK